MDVPAAKPGDISVMNLLGLTHVRRSYCLNKFSKIEVLIKLFSRNWRVHGARRLYKTFRSGGDHVGTDSAAIELGEGV